MAREIWWFRQGRKAQKLQKLREPERYVYDRMTARYEPLPDPYDDTVLLDHLAKKAVLTGGGSVDNYTNGLKGYTLSAAETLEMNDIYWKYLAKHHWKINRNMRFTLQCPDCLKSLAEIEMQIVFKMHQDLPGLPNIVEGSQAILRNHCKESGCQP